MRKIFSYSVLRFRPSYLLEEQINIGLLFVFRGERKVVFLRPNNLNRVQSFYPSADIIILEKYLKSFEQKARNLSNHTHQLDNIFKTFIPTDASNLYLTTSKSGQYSDINTTLNYYKKEYFSIYNNQASKRNWTGDFLIGIVVYLILDYFKNQKEVSSKIIKKDIQQKFGHLKAIEIENIYASVENEVFSNNDGILIQKNTNQNINIIVEKVINQLGKLA
ncbi:MAG: DUF3037 domain-containing protein [Saprospiraceae bacterium]